MDGATVGLIGGIAGAVIGIMGGVIGIYFSIKHTSGPREKAFVIRAAMIFVGVCLVLCLVWFMLPNPYKVLAFVPYWIMFPFAIRILNKKQNMIRNMEAQADPESHENT